MYSTTVRYITLQCTATKVRMMGLILHGLSKESTPLYTYSTIVRYVHYTAVHCYIGTGEGSSNVEASCLVLQQAINRQEKGLIPRDKQDIEVNSVVDWQRFDANPNPTWYSSVIAMSRSYSSEKVRCT